MNRNMHKRKSESGYLKCMLPIVVRMHGIPLTLTCSLLYSEASLKASWVYHRRNVQLDIDGVRYNPVCASYISLFVSPHYTTWHDVGTYLHGWNRQIGRNMICTNRMENNCRSIPSRESIIEPIASHQIITATPREWCIMKWILGAMTAAEGPPMTTFNSYPSDRRVCRHMKHTNTACCSDMLRTWRTEGPFMPWWDCLVSPNHRYHITGEFFLFWQWSFFTFHG